MSQNLSEKKAGSEAVVTVVDNDSLSLRHVDDAKLAELGYKSEFKREFSVRLISWYFACFYTFHDEPALRNGCVRVFHHGRRGFSILDAILWTCQRYVQSFLDAKYPQFHSPQVAMSAGYLFYLLYPT